MAPVLFDVFVETLTEELRALLIEHQLFADDLLSVGDDGTLTQAIACIDRWSAANNMEVNRRKSGVLVISGSALRVGDELAGYPVVSSYKYLGLHLNGRLDLRDHLMAINRKAGFLSHKLYGIRILDDLKLNRNLFFTFIMPSYRLAFTQFSRLSTAERLKAEAHLRVWFKKFVRIPVNTADHTLRLIAGDMMTMIRESAIRVQENLRRHENPAVALVPDAGGGGSAVAPAVVQRLRYLPKNLAGTLRAIYGSRCRHHEMCCVTTTHLVE